MNLHPLAFRVLIEPEELEETTEGGIIILDETIAANRRDTHIGTLVSIGPTAWKAFDDGEPWASIGDKVMYVKYGGNLVKDPDTGKQYVVLADEDVIMRIE